MQSILTPRKVLIAPPTSAAVIEIEGVLRGHGFSPTRLTSIQEVAHYSGADLDAVIGIVLDLSNWTADAFTFLSRVRELAGDLPILVVSDDRSVASALSAIRSGATDYLPRPYSNEELVQHVKGLAADRKSRWLRIDQAVHPTGLSRLTRCERRVLEGVLSAKTTKQISSELQIGSQTVAKHKQRVLRKLGARNDVALVLQVLAGASGGVSMRQPDPAQE